MTNTNLPDRWIVDRRFRREQLSDSAFRSYMAALQWSVANRTDGVIERRDLPHIPNFDPDDIGELLGDDLLDLGGLDRWVIPDYATTQSSRDLLESYERKLAWDRKRKARKARETAERLAGQSDSTGNSTGKFPPESSKPIKPTQPTTKAPKVPRSHATRNSRAVTHGEDR